ncbi:SprB repeat-containing protein, partial [Flavobacteriales bacterium]|nr:SprB repeat-containing protein [Flavobacteriales bacterium]
SDGDVSVVVAGGTPSYTYLWDDGGVSTTPGVGTLPAGTYTVIVTDANSCTSTISATISDLGGGTAAITASNNITCFGLCNGDATVTMTGGTSPYTYLWSDGQTSAATTNTLCAGIQTVDVTDAVGCVASVSITLTEPALLTAAITSSTDPLCATVCDGTADVTVAGGTPVYTYSWTSGGTTANETAMCAGTETVTVTDANGCITTADVILTDPALLTAAVVGTDPLCNGVCDGSADLTTTGGTGVLTYLWDDPATTTSEDVTGLCDGTFNVTVTDANGCTATDVVTVTEPTLIVLTPAFVASTCGQANGEVSVSAVGGTGAYTYLWDDAGASNTASVTGLLAGTYNVTVTDAQGCTQTIPSTITDGASGTATAVIDNQVSCFGICDGGATVTMAGGNPAFTYLWSNGETTDVATALCVGLNSVDVTDALGCVASATVTITEPAVLTAAVTSSTDPLCATVCDGTADVTVAGGTPVYTYSWTSGGTTANETAMCAGTETVTVTDANGCITTADVILTDPALLTAAVVGTDPLCNGVCDGSADLTTTGGTGVLTYLWDDPATTNSEDVTGLCDGTFNVTVTDANGCTATDVVTVTEPALIVLTTSGTDANCGQADGEVCVVAIGGTIAIAYTYQWNDANNQTTACASNIIAGAYTVNVTDDNGCPATATITI